MCSTHCAVTKVAIVLLRVTELPGNLSSGGRGLG
jgi:hypothetical protein